LSTRSPMLAAEPHPPSEMRGLQGRAIIAVNKHSARRFRSNTQTIPTACAAHEGPPYDPPPEALDERTCPPCGWATQARTRGLVHGRRAARPRRNARREAPAPAGGPQRG